MDHACFQSRIRELESRIRKFKFLKLGFIENRLRQRERRSTSADHRRIDGTSVSSSPAHQRPTNIGYMTSPMERRFVPLTMKPSPSRRDTEKEAIEVEFLETLKNSGIIEIQGAKQTVDHCDLNVLEMLGSGSCGIVESATIHGTKMAVKTMYKSDNKEDMKRILRDLKIMNMCSCPYIVRGYGYFMFDSSVKICMQKMATCCEKLLRRLYHSDHNYFFPENVSGRIAFCTITALSYLKEKHSIIHRDVKPSNILFDWDGSVRLCDFGISGYLTESLAHSNNAGCPPYMAPERLTIETKFTYDIRSDVWSLGVTIFQLATGRYPFPLHDLEFTTLTIIADLDLPSPTLQKESGAEFSPTFIDFLDQCLKKRVEDRPGYEQLMEHSFFMANDPTRIKNHKVNGGKDEISTWFEQIMNTTLAEDALRPIPNTPCVN